MPTTVFSKIKQHLNKKSSKAFTLIELLVVVAVIGILAAVGVTALSGVQESAKINATKANHSLTIKYVNSSLLKASMDNGYMRDFISVRDFDCSRAQDRKILPGTVSSVMDSMVDNLKCTIKDHPFNDPNYPAINYGPRGIKGSVEFYSRCTNQKPIIRIETVYNDNNDKLSHQIDLTDFGSSC